jgi:hypothetical protein
MTIWSSIRQITSVSDPTIIGWPVANTWFYILDEEQREVRAPLKKHPVQVEASEGMGTARDTQGVSDCERTGCHAGAPNEDWIGRHVPDNARRATLRALVIV